MKVEYDADTDTLAISLRKAKSRDASQVVGKTSETEEMALGRVAAIDLATAAASGSALPLEEHLDDPRWRALAEKHLR